MRFLFLLSLLLASPALAYCPWEGVTEAQDWFGSRDLTFAPISQKEYRRLVRSLKSESVSENYLHGEDPKAALQGFKDSDARTPQELGFQKMASLVVRSGGKQVGMVQFTRGTGTAQMGANNLRMGQNLSWEVSYFIDPAHQGEGHATESLKATANYLFNARGGQVLWARILPGNIASQRVLEKAGFKLSEEVFPAADRHFGGTKLYRLERSDWERPKPEAPLLAPRVRAAQ